MHRHPRRSSSTSSAGVSTPAAVLGVAAVAVVVAVAFAAGSLGASPAPSPAPSAPVVSPSPSAPATPKPSAPATPAPSAPASPAPSQGVDGAEIPLNVFLDHDVSLGISDPEGYLEGAVSGDAKDGMSVRWGDAIVKNLDDRTIVVTWAGLPRDEFITLVVKAQGEGYLLRFGQEAPPANSDAMGADRVVVLTFAEPVSAAQIATDFTTADD